MYSWQPFGPQPWPSQPPGPQPWPFRPHPPPMIGRRKIIPGRWIGWGCGWNGSTMGCTIGLRFGFCGWGEIFWSPIGGSSIFCGGVVGWTSVIGWPVSIRGCCQFPWSARTLYVYAPKITKNIISTTLTNATVVLSIINPLDFSNCIIYSCSAVFY